MKPALLSLMVLALPACGAGSPGGDYNCAFRCTQIVNKIVEYGYSERPYDQTSACGVESIQEARTCRACEDAIREEYRYFSLSIACDCPDESYFKTESEVPAYVTWLDGSCELQGDYFSEDVCEEYWATHDPTAFQRCDL